MQVQFNHLQPAARLQHEEKLADITVPTVGIDALCKYSTVDQVKHRLFEMPFTAIISEPGVQVPPSFYILLNNVRLFIVVFGLVRILRDSRKADVDASDLLTEVNLCFPIATRTASH